MHILDLAGVPAGYADRPVLEDIHLRIEPGERIAIVGESGAGKTTLLRAIREHCTVPAAIVPQDLGLVQALTVFHNVYMGQLHKRSTFHNLRTLFWPAGLDVEAVRDVLTPLRLPDEIFSAVRRLSGGQQQRTAVARALFNDAPSCSATSPSPPSTIIRPARCSPWLVRRRKQSSSRCMTAYWPCPSRTASSA